MRQTPDTSTGASATNGALMARRQAAVSAGISAATGIIASRAQGAELWDVEGRRYIDFAAGIAVLNVGHRHPKVVQAVREALDKVTHTAFQVVGYESYIALAERLNALAPFKAKAKSAFFTTGAEAVENAVKIARAATGRQAVISFVGNFHGRTNLAMALTGKVTPYKRQFGAPMPDIYHLPFPSTARGVTVEETLRALENLFLSDIAAESVAAIIIEPVQGEGGFYVAPDELLRVLRTLCDEHGILLIADEIQTGFARTGRMFAIEHSGVEPDLITVAKALGGGLPISGVLGRAELMDAVDPGGIGGTYAGPPLACAAALAVLDVVADEDLVARATVLGRTILDRLQGFAGRNDLVPTANHRGLGAMVAFDVLDRSGAPDGSKAKAVVTAAAAEGLLLLTAGMHGETIRFLPPLVITDALLDEGMSALERALREVASP